MDVSLTTDRSSYAIGQVVHMTFTETNDTGHAVVVRIGPRFDRFVITHGGKIVLRANAEGTDHIYRRRLLPGQSIVLTAAATARSTLGSFVVHNQLAPRLVAAPFTVVANPAGTTNSAGPLPSNVSPLLDTVYEEYLNGDLPASTGQPGQVELQGTNVGVEIHTKSPSDFSIMVTAAESLGLQVNSISETSGTVTGFLPIGALPAAAQLPGSPAIAPLLYPALN
jgi:hypothetical protein